MTLGSNKVLTFYPRLLAVAGRALQSPLNGFHSSLSYLLFDLGAPESAEGPTVFDKVNTPSHFLLPFLPCVLLGGLLYISQHPHSHVLQITAHATHSFQACLLFKDGFMLTTKKKKRLVMKLLHGQNWVQKKNSSIGCYETVCWDKGMLKKKKKKHYILTSYFIDLS